MTVTIESEPTEKRAFILWPRGPQVRLFQLGVTSTVSVACRQAVSAP